MKTKIFAITVLTMSALGVGTYAHADDDSGKVTGLAGGAVAGALVGGPVGAVIGGAVGLTAGAAVDEQKPDRVIIEERDGREYRTYE
jgi:uncharacterized protein YcfJ